ncbi:MAG: Mov34/MPN/PAD-1 family protein [Myxococcales bacterium]
MPVLVLPPSVCQLCALPRELEVQGATVAQVLSNAARQHPEAGRLLLDELGVPRRHYPVFKNEDDVRSLGGVQIDVGPEDVVSVLPPIAGGAAAEEALADCVRYVSVHQHGPRPDWLRRAIEHAEEAYPEEACGLVVRAESGQLEAIRSRNVSERPRDQFELEPDVGLLTALRTGRLQGFYHSHPDGPAKPSAEDLEKARLWGPELEWTIVSVRSGRAGEVASYRLSQADGA